MDFLNTIFGTTTEIQVHHIMIAGTIKEIDEKLEELDAKSRKTVKQSGSMFA